MNLSSGAALRRAGILVLLVAALLLPPGAGSRWSAHEPGARVFLLDVSFSIDPVPLGALARGAALLREAAVALPEGSDLGAVAFAESAAAIAPIGSASRLPSPFRVPPGIGDPRETDLERAVRYGLDLLAGRARGSDLVLVSDGRQTRGDVERAAREAAARGTRIHVVPLDPAPREVPGILALEGPPAAAEGNPIAVRARVAAPRDREAIVRIAVRADPDAGLSVPVAASAAVAAGDERSFDFLLPPLASGFRVLEAVLSETSSSSPRGPEPDRATHGLVVGERARALLLSERPSSAVRAALESAGFSVEAQAGDAAAAALAGADLVVLHDLPRARLAPRLERAIVSLVAEGGGGLVVLGGQRSFGPGGYRGSDLEGVLPVACGPEAPGPMRLVLLVDRSGSMAADGKALLALQAVDSCLQSLSPSDQLAVGLFAEETSWVVRPFADKGQAAALLAERLSRYEPRGDTDLERAVQEALDLFATIDPTATGPRHLLVVSDGRANGDFAALGERLAGARIRTSVVATGDDVDESSLRALTRDGANGRLDRWSARSAGAWTLGELVQRDLFAEEIREAESPVVERERVDWLTRPEGGFPPIRGWARTRPKPRASVLLVEEHGDPLLASWRVGRGTVAAFTSDPAGPWASAYAPPSPLVGDLARHVAREARAASDYWFEIDRIAGVLDLVAGRAAVEAAPAIRTGRLAGRSETLTLEPIAPGRWRARLPAWPAGSYLVTILDEREGSSDGRRVPLDVPPSAEFESGPVDRDVLERVASLTGGSLGDGAPLEPPAGGGASAATGVGRDVLALAALLLILADLVLPGLRARLQPARAPGR